MLEAKLDDLLQWCGCVISKALVLDDGQTEEERVTRVWAHTQRPQFTFLSQEQLTKMNPKCCQMNSPYLCDFLILRCCTIAAESHWVARQHDHHWVPREIDHHGSGAWLFWFGTSTVPTTIWRTESSAILRLRKGSLYPYIQVAPSSVALWSTYYARISETFSWKG